MQNVSSRLPVRRVFLPVMLLSLAVGCGTGPQSARPNNRTAVILDLSGTFRQRIGGAVTQVRALLSEMGKTDLKRYERDRDGVSLVALDALPDVIWSGTLPGLAELSDERLTQLVAGRSDYRGCTDVVRAFETALHALGDDPHSQRYLFVFSDLIDEPAGGSLSQCHPASNPSPPPAGMPWDRLEKASVSAFWVPSRQKLAWQREIDKLGLSDVFRIHTESESLTSAIIPPPRPIHIVTDEDRAASRQAVGTTLRTAGLVVTGLVVMGAAVLVLVVRFSRPARRKAPQPVRPR